MTFEMRTAADGATIADMGVMMRQPQVAEGTASRRTTTRILDLLIVALIAVACWLAWTALHAPSVDTTPTYQPGSVVPETPRQNNNTPEVYNHAV